LARSRAMKSAKLERCWSDQVKRRALHAGI
jgi:hypothetical protein